MKSLKLLIIVSVIVLILPIAAAAGTSLFDDVPDSNIFVDDINWLKTNDITKGCNEAGTEFCPEAPVLRQEMAAFMHRLADSRAVDAGELGGIPAGSFIYNADWEVKSESKGVAANSIVTTTAYCPLGKYVVSGGGSATYKQLTLMSSHPVRSLGVKIYNGWSVTWVNDGLGVLSTTLTANALCAGRSRVIIP